MSGKRPEHEVLLYLTRSKPGDVEQSELHKLLRKQIDYEYLLQLAHRHGLLPLLYARLTNLETSSVPATLLEQARSESLLNLQLVLHFFTKLIQVNQLLSENEITVAVFKGPLLAQMAYGDASLRKAGDIDILISPTDFPKTRTLLEALGYRMIPPLSDRQLRAHLNFHCEIQFLNKDDLTVIDLHWGITPKSFTFNLDTMGLLSRVQTVRVGPDCVRTFGPEDLIIFLAMHGTKHLWSRLEWICSFANLIRDGDAIDWSVVSKRSAEARGARMLGLALRLVQLLTNVKVPEEVLARIDKNKSLLKLATKIEEGMFAGSSRDTASLRNAVYNFKVMDHKRDAVLSAARAIYTPTLSDFEFMKVPADLYSLYYAVRPLRLSASYAGKMFRRLTFPAKTPLVDKEPPR